MGTKPQKRKQKHLLIFQPSGRRGYIDEGKTIKEASQGLGVELESICGGKATCGKCKVSIQSGMENLSPMEDGERKLLTKQQERDGYRLACVARIYGDVLVFVPEESRAGRQMVRKSVTERAIEIKPAVRKYYVELVPAALEHPQGDWERLQAELNSSFDLDHLTIDYQVLLSLQEVVRRGHWKVTVSVWVDREVIKVEPGLVDRGYGLAVDIGTSTVAGYLCDLSSGEVVASDAMVNPQVIYGEDVMTRITYAVSNEGGLQRMNKAIVKGVNQMAGRVALQAGMKRHSILDMTVVGNTCMHHLFLAIDPQYLGRAPFPPSIHHSLDMKARDLGLKISPGAYVHVLPIEAGFVGADNVGVLIAEEPHKQDEMVLTIDIGTNGELVLGNRAKLVSCSCATGPAFEGGHIKYGMRAAAGAIEKVEIDPDSKEARFKVIGDAEWNTDSEAVKAKGICGSGIIDAIAQMFKAGIFQRSGRFNTDLETPRLRVTEEGPEFVIAWANDTSINQDIIICQDDVGAVQLAKGAMYAGAKLLMRRLAVDRLDKIILAGAFGSYIDKESAATIGLFPDCALENIYAVGNAAGDGARIALLNVDKRREGNEIARQVEYIELTVESDFERQFAQAMYFPHMKDTFPQLEHLLAEKVIGEH